MKHLYRIIFVCLLCVPAHTINAEPEVSVGIGRFYYEIGGGKLLPPPGSGIYTFRISSPILNVSMDYSCGRFSYHDNINEIINNFTSQMRQIPSQLAGAFTAAIAGLPNYWLMKVNASYYNTITKMLDDSTELFRLSYKSCEQMEEELRRNPDTNPYQGFIGASIMERWHYGAHNNENITDTHDDIKNNPMNPIVWFGGNRAGTASNPIQVNRDFVVAGYNIMLGRTGDVSITAPPTGPAAQEPIVRVWSNPAEAGQWIQEVIGDHILVLESGASPNEQSIPGKGLRPKVEELEVEIEAALREVYDHNDYTDINNYLSLPKISGKVAEGLRTLPRGESEVLIDQLVSEMAVMEAKERLLQARQMIYATLKHPDILSLPYAGGAASNKIYKTTLPAIQVCIEEIVEELEIRQRTVNPTILAIIDRADAARKAGHAARPGVTHKEQRVE